LAKLVNLTIKRLAKTADESRNHAPRRNVRRKGENWILENGDSTTKNGKRKKRYVKGEH